MEDELDSGFTADEHAYFESEGENVAPGLGEDTEPLPESTGQGGEQVEPGQPEDGDEPEKKGGFVPHGAFHSEREERKKAEARVAELERNQAILNDRWNTLLTMGQNGGKQPEATAEPKPDTPPDPTTDLVGYIAWNTERVQRFEDEQRQRQQQAEAERADAEVWNVWDSACAHARTIQPDFDQASNFLADLRDKQLEALAIVDPRFAQPQGRFNQINGELRDIINGSRARGMNPAQAIYQMAQSYGYQPDAAPSANPAPQDADPANVQKQTMEKIEALDKAQAASRTLGVSGGTNTGDPLSAEAIAAMSTAEFEAWMTDPKNSRLYDRLLGDNA